MKNKVFFSSFILKILAIVFMTLDHIAIIFLSPYIGTKSSLEITYWILRFIGRLSFPLFAFLVSEALSHTHSKLNYCLRLGIMALVISLPLLVLELTGNQIPDVSNIFIDLVLASLIITTLSLNKYYKLFVILPISVYITLLMNEYFNFLGVSSFNLQYSFLGVPLILLFYYGKYISLAIGKSYCNKGQIDFEVYKELPEFRFLSNIVATSVLVIVNLICWMVVKIIPAIDTLLMDVQVISLFAFIFILFYNGQLGYNKKWFKYGAYLYYPLHILILYGLSFLI